MRKNVAVALPKPRMDERIWSLMVLAVMLAGWYAFRHFTGIDI